MVTKNGRPAQMGSLYFEKQDEGFFTRKYFVSYCPHCKEKIGLTNEEIKQFAQQIHAFPLQFLQRILRARIIVP